MVGPHNDNFANRLKALDGEMGARIADHPWEATELGPIHSWPESLRAVIGLILMSPVPMALMWGGRGTMLYNDGYAMLAGTRHPDCLGTDPRESWPEIATLNNTVIRACLAGQTLRYRGEKLEICRSGQPEIAWFDLDYSPVLDDRGIPVGLLAIVIETTERLRAEAALRGREEELQMLADALPALVSFMDVPEPGELRYRFVNSMYERWFSRKREEIEGRRVRDVMGDAAYKLVRPTIEEALSGRTISFERFMPYEGAPHRHVRIQFTPRCTASGEVTGLYSLVEDITDQKNAEAALRQSEEQLRLATDAGDIGLWDFDPVADTLFWPARVKAMFGIAAEDEVSIRDFYAGLHPEDSERITQAFAATADPQIRALYDVEYRAIGRDDGVVRWIAARGRGVFDEDGRCIRLVGAAIDITQRKADEERLHDLYENLEKRVAEALAERKLLVDVIDGTDLFVQVADADFSWLAINRAASHEFARIFGVPPPQAGDNMLDALAGQPVHQAAVRDVWSRALAGAEFVEVAAFGDPSRDRRYYEMRFRPLRDVEGQLVGAYQFVSDVTERIGEQERLREAEEALRQGQKMQALGQLAGGIAHDFNNLLGAIVGSLDLVLNRSQLDERTRRSISNAFTAAKRGSRLTAQLLAFARAQKIELRPLLISELLERMRELLDRTLGPNIDLRLELDTVRAPILSDPTQLEMAVLNLAINARDAMPEGGTLTIRKNLVEIEDDPELGSGEYVQLSVTDTGTGMPAEVAARAFDPFFTTKNVGEGTGLGLSQVYGIARQAGGTARISSRAGEGTTVSLILPRTTRQAVTEEPEYSADTGGAARSATILVVDDDAGMRQFLAESLDVLGYTVLTAADGPEGLEMVRDRDVPDLAIVDFAMPGMNGAEFATALAKLAPEVPVLFASGYANTDALGEIAEEDGMLRKPFGLETLRSAVERKLTA